MKYNVEAIFSLTDHVSGPVRQMAAGLKNLDTGMSHVTSAVGALKAAAGAAFAGFGIGKIVGDTTAWYEQVEKLNRELGMSAREASQIMGAFSLTDSGVEALNSHTRMWAMNMKGLTELGEDMALSMGKTAKANPWKALKDGSAVGSLLEIADKVNKAVGDPLLVAATYYKRGIAQQMLPALKLGRQGLMDLMAEAKKSGVEVTEAGLASFARFKDARRELELTWKGLSLEIGNELMPLMKELIDAMRPKLLNAMQSIRSPLRWFAQNMEGVLKTVKAITYYMLINKGLMMTTGAGVFGNIGRGAIAAGAPMGNAIGLVRNNWAGTVALGTRAGAASAAGSTLLSGAMGSIGVIAAGIARLSLLGGILWKIGEGALAIYRNTDGIRDYLVQTWEGLVDSAVRLWGTIRGIFGAGADDSIGKMSTWWDLMVPLALDSIGKIVTAFLDFFTMLVTEFRVAYAQYRMLFMGGDRGQVEQAGQIARMKAEGDAQDARASYYRKQFDAAKKVHDKMEADRLAEDKAKKAMRGKDMNLNFPGATFNIKQDFRDQDPDRVAVVFQEDLQALALNRVTSNVTDLSFAAQTGF
ncbi:MAG: hypothetical protein WC700_18405 [Gemmatimonadaceae bacterium]